MTESAAPIQYFFRQNATATSLVSIDIGGGTTDIAFAKDGDLQNVTSFKFASNDLLKVRWMPVFIMELLTISRRL